jgi:hypothetical protein
MADYPFKYEDVRSLTQEQLFGIIDDWINCNSWNRNDLTKFSDKLNRTHRTLQESFVAMFWSILVQYGRDHKEDYTFDPRNESAVMLCRRFVEMVDNKEVPTYLPYI